MRHHVLVDLRLRREVCERVGNQPTEPAVRDTQRRGDIGRPAGLRAAAHGEHPDLVVRQPVQAEPGVDGVGEVIPVPDGRTDCRIGEAERGDAKAEAAYEAALLAEGESAHRRVHTARADDQIGVQRVPIGPTPPRLAQEANPGDLMVQLLEPAEQAQCLHRVVPRTPEVHHVALAARTGRLLHDHDLAALRRGNVSERQPGDTGTTDRDSQRAARSRSTGRQATPLTSSDEGLSTARQVDLRRQFSNVPSAAKFLVVRLLQRVGKTDQVGTNPVFEDARGPNVREIRCAQRRLSRPEVEALVADYDAGGRVRELAQIYGITALRSRRTSYGRAGPAAS